MAMSSQAYTPGLKRKELYLVRKVRRMPVPGEVLVKEGDLVYPKTVVAVTNVPGEHRIVNVPAIMHVDAMDVMKYVLKKEGGYVKKGELLALKKGFFGTRVDRRECSSPYEGVVEFIGKTSGQVIIIEPPIPLNLTAYILGTVAKVIPREGAIIETPAAFIQGIFGIGGETSGDVKVIANSPKEVLEAGQIGKECVGKVLVGGSLVTGDALNRAVEVGAEGIIVGGIEYKDLNDFLGYMMGVAVTGHEEVGLTLIVTEGFSKMNMSEKTFEIFREFEGKVASINGATQIRAGVIRPEIIIPRNDVDKDALSRSETDDILSGGMMLGTPVRIIREPDFGALGHVVSLPVELQKIETESYIRILEAELDDGRRIIVPRANVEIIEE